MALVTCPDCGKKHSDQASACPQCGRPNAAPKPQFQTPPPQAPKKKGGCLKIALYAFGGFILLGIIAGLVVDTPPETQPTEPQAAAPETSAPTAPAVSSPQAAAPEATEPETTEPETKKEEKSLEFGFTREEFQKKFNAAAKELQLSHQLVASKSNDKGPATPTPDGSVVWGGTIGKNSACSIFSNAKSKKIQTILFFVGGAQTQQDTLDAFLTIGSLMMAMNPELTASQRGDVLKELNLMDTANFGAPSSFTRGGVMYESSLNKAVGLFFITVKPAGEPIIIDVR